MLKWSVSLTMLFKEVDFLERFDAAAQAGFGAVEFMWPIGVELDALVGACHASGLEVALFNIDSGDVTAGERGFPNDPAKRDWWCERALLAIELAGRLNCTRINVQAGNDVAGLSAVEIQDCLAENLAWAVEQAPGVTFFLEPLNRFENPHYILERVGDVIKVIDRVGSPRVKLMLDIYHAQRTEGNLTDLMRSNITHIGHIQIADSPARNQPGTGEIHWPFVFGQMEALGYAGFIGLEYNPLPDSTGSLGWLPEGMRVACGVEDLNL